jgi:thiamine-monophosphate kinase
LSKRGATSENEVIQQIERAFGLGSLARGGSRDSHLTLGMGDDAALFRPTAGHEVVLTCDWFLEGTHFLRDKHPADAVGWKCLARAVSDIAAMGGVPRCFLLSLALPKKLPTAWMTGFLGGLRRAARRFGCELAGGDTTARTEILINLAVVGEVARGKALRRDGAQVGDLIYVSGRLGEADAGLRLLQHSRKRLDARDSRLRKHFYPEPRIALGQWLRSRRLATSGMDLSDGLSSDLARMCAASEVGAIVDTAKLPTVQTAGARRTARHKAEAPDAVALALHGGDDYELLFTVAKKSTRYIPASLGGLKLTAIGEVTRGRGVLVTDIAGRTWPLEPAGWDPFRTN